MPEYPEWVGFVAYLGLDPIAVWTEYRSLFLAALSLAAALVLGACYLLGLQAKLYYATFRYAFADRIPLYKYIEEMPARDRDRAFHALDAEPLVYGMPAIAMKQVPGFDKAVGYLLLSATRLVFTSGPKKIAYPVESVVDASIQGGLKYVEVKVDIGEKQPSFYLLGISREQTREVFTKLYLLGRAIRDRSVTG